MRQIKTILSVLRSGGVYTPEYVRKLKNGVENASKGSIRFICLTDLKSIDFCETIPLKHNWNGWWSKIELFRPDLNVGKAIYFDLDVLILKDIEQLLNTTDELPPFSMLKGWNERSGVHPSSSIMAGKFDLFSEIYEAFKEDPTECIKSVRFKKGAGMQGDQGFIADFVGYDIPYIQEYLPANYIIGKRMYIKDSDLINQAHILSWSGNPRLHTMKKLWNYEVIHPVSNTQ